MRPFCEKATPRTAAVCALSTVDRPSADGVHSRTVLSLEAEATRLWVGSYATQVTAPWWPRKRKARSVGLKCHSITAPSAPPLTTCRMLLLKATEVTASRWPRKQRSSAGSCGGRPWAVGQVGPGGWARAGAAREASIGDWVRT